MLALILNRKFLGEVGCRMETSRSGDEADQLDDRGYEIALEPEVVDRGGIAQPHPR